MKQYNNQDMTDRHFIAIRLTGKKKAQAVYSDLLNSFPSVKDITEIHDKEILIEILQGREYGFALNDIRNKYPDANIDCFAFDETARNNRRWYRMWTYREH